MCRACPGASLILSASPILPLLTRQLGWCFSQLSYWTQSGLVAALLLTMTIPSCFTTPEIHDDWITPESAVARANSSDPGHMAALLDPAYADKATLARSVFGYCMAMSSVLSLICVVQVGPTGTHRTYHV